MACFFISLIKGVSYNLLIFIMLSQLIVIDLNVNLERHSQFKSSAVKHNIYLLIMIFLFNLLTEVVKKSYLYC